MRHKGKITQYRAQRGFGWIASETILQHRFFHISQWQGTVVPQIGQIVEFTDGIDKNKRPQAQAIVPVLEVAPAVTPAAETSTKEAS